MLLLRICIRTSNDVIFSDLSERSEVNIPRAALNWYSNDFKNFRAIFANRKMQSFYTHNLIIVLFTAVYIEEISHQRNFES